MSDVEHLPSLSSCTFSLFAVIEIDPDIRFTCGYQIF